MGQSMSPDQRIVELDKFSDGLFASEQWQGIGIDSSLLSYSGLNSTDELDRYRDHVIDIPSAVEKLGGAFAGLTMVPNAVGLGALVISMMLEIILKSLGQKTKGTAEMLQRVFAEEKGNEVRDLMEEYLKRLQINLGKPQLQLADTRRIESDLSAQLTRLKNSMLVDGHLDSRLLKQWVNGAAFHTQMLIHQARLEGADGSRAVSAAGFYQRQLNVIMDKYKKYLNDITYLGSDHNLASVYCCLYFKERQFFHFPAKCFPQHYSYCVTETEVVETMFSKHQISWTKSYFSDLAAHIPTLARQNATFQIRH